MTATVVRTATIDSPVEDVWEVLADFGGISAWASNVDHSCLLSQEVERDLTRIVRRIQTGRTTVLERVQTWDEPSVLAYGIEGLPPVVRSVVNEWRLNPAGITHTAVALTTTVDCGSRPPLQLIATIVARRLAKESDSMLAGLTHHMSTRKREDTSHV